MVPTAISIVGTANLLLDAFAIVSVLLGGTTVSRASVPVGTWR